MLERVKVVVRVRPTTNKSCVTCRGNTVAVRTSESDSKCFEFDGVLDAGCAGVYEKTGSLVVRRVLDGYNATVMAYGQTGSGKTFTLGNPAEDAEAFAASVTGRCVAEIFKGSGDAKIVVSYLEVYNEGVYDLLTDGGPLSILDDAQGQVVVRNLSESAVATVDEVAALLRQGGVRRRVGATRMNAESSRSHAICSLRVTQRDGTEGKLCVVDLAGSERARKTGAQGDRLNEGIQINKGLLVLGQVISTLAADSQEHAPFRDSKLTRLLRDSLGGTASTVMIACVGPEEDHRDETLNTLRYAARARNVANVAVRHVAAPNFEALVENLRKENAELKAQLVLLRQAPSSVLVASTNFSDDEDDDEREGDDVGRFTEEAFLTDDDEDDDAPNQGETPLSDETEVALKSKFAEAVRLLEEELSGLEKARDEAAAELKKKQATLANLPSGPTAAAKRKEVEALRDALKARSQMLVAKARELDAARRDRDRLKAEIEAGRAKRVELEKKLRGETAARAKGERLAQLAARRAARQVERSKAALTKLERAHEVQAAILRRRCDEKSKVVRRHRRTDPIMAAKLADARQRLAQRDAAADKHDNDDDKTLARIDTTTLDARLEAKVEADVERALAQPPGHGAKRANVHLPPLSAADARLALRWYHSELVRLRAAAHRSMRPRLSSGAKRARKNAISTKDPHDSESSWVEDEDGGQDDEDEDVQSKKQADRKPRSADDVDALTVADIKVELRRAGLKLAGRKSELLERLREHRRTGSTVATVVVAAYDCTPDSDSELGFRSGDRITVLDQSDDGWWRGILPNGRSGLFPSNYVRPLTEASKDGKQTAASSRMPLGVIPVN